MGAHSDFLDAWKNSLNQHPHEIPSYSQVRTKEGLVLAEASNRVEDSQNASYHSEFLAIHLAMRNSNSKYLTNCMLFTSLEPCLQCAGTIIKAKIPEVIYFLPAKPGEGISSLSVENLYLLNHFPKLTYTRSDLVQKEFSQFFQDKR